jgi:hypothetical protein
MGVPRDVPHRTQAGWFPPTVKGVPGTESRIKTPRQGAKRRSIRTIMARPAKASPFGTLTSILMQALRPNAPVQIYATGVATSARRSCAAASFSMSLPRLRTPAIWKAPWIKPSYRLAST